MVLELLQAFPELLERTYLDDPNSLSGEAHHLPDRVEGVLAAGLRRDERAVHVARFPDSEFAAEVRAR